MLRNPNWGTGAAGNSEFGHAEKSGQENVADRRIWFLIISGLSATPRLPWYMLCRACMQKMHASSELESSDMQCRSGGFGVEGGSMRGSILRVTSGVDVAVRARARARALEPQAGREVAHSERRSQVCSACVRAVHAFSRACSERAASRCTACGLDEAVRARAIEPQGKQPTQKDEVGQQSTSSW